LISYSSGCSSLEPSIENLTYTCVVTNTAPPPTPPQYSNTVYYSAVRGHNGCFPLCGIRGDEKINENSYVQPSYCRVTGVEIQTLDNGHVVTATAPPGTDAKVGPYGARITFDDVGSNGLEVHVHYWADHGSGIHYRIAYTIYGDAKCFSAGILAYPTSY